MALLRIMLNLKSKGGSKMTFHFKLLPKSNIDHLLENER